MQRAAAQFGDLYSVILDGEVESARGMVFRQKRIYDFATSTTSVREDGTQVRYDVQMSDSPIAVPPGHNDGRTTDIYVDGQLLRTTAVTSGPAMWSVSFRSPNSKFVLITSEGEPPSEITLEASPYRVGILERPRLFRRRR